LLLALPVHPPLALPAVIALWVEPHGMQHLLCPEAIG